MHKPTDIEHQTPIDDAQQAPDIHTRPNVVERTGAKPVTTPSTGTRRPPAGVKDRLENISVLLDTYNLRQKKGSGIKTYGLTLAEALDSLGASISLLGDRVTGHSKKKGLDEVLFYDHRPNEGRILGTLRNAWRGTKRLLTPTGSTPIENQYVIPDRPIRAVPGAERIFNVGRIYETANESYKRIRRFTTVKPPRQIDLYHATTLLPIRMRGVPTVTTVHDVIPLRLPYTTLDDKKFFYHLLEETIRTSDLVLTVSECTKRDIQRFFDVPDEKVIVTYQSVPFRMYDRNPALEQAVMRRYGLNEGSYLLFVGNIEPKKNIGTLIEAVSGMVEELPLIVVGRKGWLWKEELEHAEAHFGSDLSRRFRMLGYVPRHDLHALYACASALVFPSLYEGFGLPPLEAFAHGCPVICSDVASLPEVCADAALYVDPYEPDSIRARIEDLLDDEQLRSALVEKGFRRLAEFSPARYANRLADAYGTIL